MAKQNTKINTFLLPEEIYWVADKKWNIHTRIWVSKNPKKVTPKYDKQRLFVRMYTNTKISDVIDNVMLLWYVSKLASCMEIDNTIDFDSLWLSESYIKPMRSKMRKLGIVNKYKWRWYMNPLFFHRDKEIETVLIELFQEVNKEKYWITRL